MRSSTADCSPPIVMSSQCTVATMCSPLMQTCHTHGHAIPLVNLRSLSVDASSSFQFCAARNTLIRAGISTPFVRQHQCHDISSTCTRGNFPPHYFQRSQRRRRRVQLWPRVRLIFPSRPTSSDATNVILAACSSHVLGGSCPHFSRHVARAGVLVNAEDPPWETEGFGDESCCNFLLKLRLGKTDNTGPLQHASYSWILGRVSLNCIKQCTTKSFVSRSQSCGPRRVASQQDFNSPPTCFTASLLSSLPSLRYKHPKHPSVRPVIEVSSRLCSPQKTSHRGRGTVSAGLSILTAMPNALLLPSGDHGTARE